MRGFYSVPRCSTSTATRSTATRAATSWSASASSNLDGLPDAQRNWANDHTVYTHGYGVIAAYGNQQDADDKPVHEQQGPAGLGGGEAAAERPAHRPERRLPAADLLRREAARLLHRRRAQGHQAGRARRPAAARAAPASRTTTYDQGKAGVPIGVDVQPDAVRAEVRRRRTSCCPAGSTRTPRSSTTATPRERVEKVAPWLTVDGDAYPAVVDGKWSGSSTATRRRPLPDVRAPLAGGDDPDALDPRQTVRHAADRPDQLHAQLGEGRPSTPTTAP